MELNNALPGQRQMRALAQGAALHKYTAWPHACAAVAVIAEVRKPFDA
jgi:hypothetical protein